MQQEKIDKKQTQKNNVQSFQFLKKLGQGAYSSVYKVRRKVDSQLYALKKVKMKNLSTKEKQNSLNEVRILASINHPNVISYKEAFFEAESLYIVMQYADSGDLFGEISNRKKKDEFYKQEQIWSVFYQICAGLHELHKLKIIHRDLKSANIFINKSRQVKLGDMNVSKVGDLCMTQTGTPYYASPQVWKDMPYDHKSDIWSLGCVLYEMITFSPPFQGIDMEDLYQNIVLGKYNQIPSNYSQNLKLMINGLLQQIPAKRPNTGYMLQNIEQIIPQNLHNSNSIIKNLIKRYSKNSKKMSTKQSYRINQLMKTIQFPNRKKNKNMLDSQITSFLPSPSYSKSHRTTKQKSIKVQNSSLLHNKLDKKQIKQKLKPQSLFVPAVNISLDENSLNNMKKKKMKNNNSNKQNKENKQNKKRQEKQNNLHKAYGHPVRKSLIIPERQKEKDHQRLILPTIQNKRIHHQNRR